MTNAWFVVAPTGESQGSFLNPKVPDGSRLTEVATGSAAYKAWVGNESYNGWQVVMGPFATEAQAKAAHPPAALSAVLTAAGLASSTAAQSAVGSEPSLPGATVSNPLDAISGFIKALTEANTWIRVAKVIIGGTLVIVGLAHISGAGNAVATTARRVPLPI
jgi:hypothetical protein